MKRVSTTTDLITYNVEDVNRLIVHIFFPFKKDKKDMVKVNLLVRLMNNYSKKYNQIGALDAIERKLYILDYDAASQTTENYGIIDFNLIVPKDGIIDEFSLDKAFEFFHEMIFNQNFVGEEYENTIFNDEKTFILDRLSIFPKDINDFAYDAYDKFIDDEYISHDEYVEIMKKVTPGDLYEQYKKIILDNNYVSVISGAITDENAIREVYNKYFKQEKKKIEFDLNHFRIDKNDKYEERVYEKNYNQSMLCMHYIFKDYKEEEFMKLKILGWLLDSKENNLIYHKLRGENNLIYTYNTSWNDKKGTFDVFVYSNYEDIPKIKELLNEVLTSFNTEEMFNNNKNNSIKAIKYDLLSNEDNPFTFVNDEYDKMIGYSGTLSDKLDVLVDMSYSTMMEFISRAINTKVMIVKAGDNNE